MMTIKERVERAKAAEFLTVEDVALLWRFSPKTIYNKASRGEIPGRVKFGRALRFKRTVIVKWGEEQQFASR